MPSCLTDDLKEGMDENANRKKVGLIVLISLAIEFLLFKLLMKGVQIPGFNHNLLAHFVLVSNNELELYRPEKLPSVRFLRLPGSRNSRISVTLVPVRYSGLSSARV